MRPAFERAAPPLPGPAQVRPVTTSHERTRKGTHKLRLAACQLVVRIQEQKNISWLANADLGPAGPGTGAPPVLRSWNDSKPHRATADQYDPTSAHDTAIHRSKPWVAGSTSCAPGSTLLVRVRLETGDAALGLGLPRSFLRSGEAAEVRRIDAAPGALSFWPCAARCQLNSREHRAHFPPQIKNHLHGGIQGF